MMVLISPAKTLDFESKPVVQAHSQPRFLDDSAELIDVLREQSPADLSDLMKISSKLADLNYQRYGAWQPPFSLDNAKQALLAFRGDVYTGLAADDWARRDFTWAQDHLRILSGLYGVLRPLDLIQPYRLEMGTRLANPRGADLYAFWREKLTATLNAELADTRRPLVVNLASNEYWGAVDAGKLEASVVTPNFKEAKDGGYRFVSFFGKKARGLMAGWIVRERIKTAARLKDFAADGYCYNEAESTPERPVFTRDASG